MTRDFSCDTDPDRFYWESLQIGVPEIKEALKSRFRAEQIARLGNAHIIYPAIQRRSFERVIANELDKLAGRILRETGITIEFAPSIRELIYAEGVYPTQGFRPLFSTIHQLITSTMGFFLSDRRVWRQRVDRMRLEARGKELMATFAGGRGTAFTSALPLKTPMSDLREGTKDDRQAVAAVHEAGHAVVHMVVERRLPKAVHATSTNVEAGGFLVVDDRKPIKTREELFARAATYLAGIAAERLVFGPDAQTTGGEGDIRRATNLVSRLMKEAGMGTCQVSYGLATQGDEGRIHAIEGVEEEVKTALATALCRAEEALKAEWNLFLNLADHLSDHSRLGPDELLGFCRRHSVTGLGETLRAGGEGIAHRHLLKKVVQEAGQGGLPVRPLVDRLRTSPPEEEEDETVPAVAN